MADLTERRLGYAFALGGGLLIMLGALIALAVGSVDLVLGRPFALLDALSEAVVLFVVGGLSVFFAYLGRHGWSDRPVTSGVLLIVLAVVGWSVLELGGNVVALIGAVFVLLAGVLYLIGPAKHVVTTALPT